MATARSHPVTLAGLSAVAAGTTLVSLLTWQGFTERYGDTLGPLVVIAVLVAGTGAVARWWRVPRPLLVLAQVVLVAMVVSGFVSGSPLPIGDAWERFQLAFTDAVDSANRFAPPVPAEAPPVHPLLIAGGAACLLLTDLLACTLRRVPLAGLPLLTIYSVPVSMTGDGPHWILFTITAVGFLAMIFLSESEQVSRWGPILAEDLGGSEPKTLSTAAWPRTGARTIGGVATALAIVVPVLIPTFSIHLFDFGPGTGGDDDISIENPMVDLRRDLVRGADVPLVTVRTDDPDPSYLRIAVLNRFSENEWSSGDREVPSTQTADGQMPGLVGVSNLLPRDNYDYELSATGDFESTWLPTTSNVTQVEAPGDWRFDTSTMDFLASDDDLDTAGLSWSLSAVKVQYDATRMATAGPVGALVSRDFTTLPTGMNPIIRQLTQQVTANAESKFEKAVALQRWFRAEGNFEYSTEVDLRTGEDDLVAFLEPQGRVGYCEQFAAAMAVMARELGIPARVAVGFLQPERDGDQWVYSAHDLHAWPELFFPGSGWVRFEPTPPTRANGVPGYTTAPIDIPDDSELTATATDQESAGNRPQESGRPDAAAETAAGEDGADAGGGFPWLPVVIGAGVLLLVVATVLGPRTVRRRRRDQRGLLGAEEAWQELRDTALDLRLPWPSHRSPWQTREALVQLFGAATSDEFSPERPRRGPDVNPDAVFALDRIVHALERLRYARPDTAEHGTYRAEMQACVEALYGGTTKRARRAAEWWPRSVFRRPTPVRTTGPDAPVEPALAGKVVDRVG